MSKQKETSKLLTRDLLKSYFYTQKNNFNMVELVKFAI